MSLSSLEEVLKYRNSEVIARFCVDHKATSEEGEELFRETLRWLWFCAYQLSSPTSRKIATIPLVGEITALDLMWHTFLLFTKDYADFCNQYFGFFIHHTPVTQAEKKLWKEKMAQDLKAAREEKEALLRTAYEAIYEVLGEDVLLTWMEVFPEKYARLASLEPLDS